MGWYMVKSGLVNNFDDPNDVPRVSQYRLASHLGLAFGLYSLLLWSALDKLLPPKPFPTAAIGNADAIKRARFFRRLAHASKALVFVTALSGMFFLPSPFFKRDFKRDFKNTNLCPLIIFPRSFCRWIRCWFSLQ